MLGAARSAVSVTDLCHSFGPLGAGGMACPVPTFCRPGRCYDRRLRRAPEITLAAVFVVWMVLAAPILSTQLGRSAKAWETFSGLSAEERDLRADPVAVQVARDVAAGVPEDGCVTVLAYVGADAAEYYRGRLAYLLYPRRVRLFPRSRARTEGCGHLAVFRNMAGNLRGSPFQGRWDQGELDAWLETLEQVHRGELAQVYRLEDGEAE